jgi:GDPmannose 4,6-dehydratase
MGNKALITGVTGQDGAYLSKFLLEKGYQVYGLLARRSSDTQWRLRYLGIENDVDLREGDLTDLSSLTRLLDAVKVDEVYNLGAQSFVATSWMQPILTGFTTGIGAVHLLEAIRSLTRQSIFTKPPAARCLARFGNRCNRKPRLFIRAARTAWRSFMPTG